MSVTHRLHDYKGWERVLCEVRVEAEERVEPITQHSTHGWHQN
jgi:hypothetical protein